jgi:signal transduction histidine kinase
MTADSLDCVLAIDDDVDTQANLRDILELDGYHVEAAGTVGQALARGDLSEFSVILLDRKLPDGSGDILLPLLRQRAPQAAVIIMTGYADTDGFLTALHHGAADYFLKPINPDLVRATLARVRKLKEAEQRAVQAERLAAIGQTVAVLAHEGRNALHRATSCVALLRARAADRPDLLDLAAIIQRALGNLQRLFDDVQGFAAPLQLEQAPRDLRSVWRQAWANLAPRRAGRDVQMREEVNGDDLVCLVDPFRLEQVFRNLFENALAACPGPVTITVGCAQVTLHEQPALRVSVRDNGPGLAPEQRRRVFEPFYTTKTKGTGLGLAITQRIVEAHGGQIAAMEVTGPGAEFELVLPRGAF